MVTYKCPKNPEGWHRYDKGVCIHCGEDSFDFEREVIKSVIKKLSERGEMQRNILDDIKRELLEGRPIDKKLAKFIEGVSVDTLQEFSDELNKVWEVLTTSDKCPEREDYVNLSRSSPQYGTHRYECKLTGDACNKENCTEEHT